MKIISHRSHAAMNTVSRPLEAGRGHSLLNLLSIRDYRLLLIGNALAFSCVQLRSMAQAWWVLEETGSPVWVGIVNSAPALGLILFSLLGGTIADRTDRRKILVRSRFLASALAFLTAYLVASDYIAMWNLIVIGIAAGTVFAFNNPASQTYVMDVVGRESLLPAISLNRTIGSVARIGGPALGGIVLASLGLFSMFLLLCGMYAAAFAVSLFLKTRTEPVRPTSSSVLTDLKDGVRYVWKTPHVRWLLIISLTAIFIGMFPALIPLYALTILDSPFDREVAYGVLLSSTGIGALIGSIALTAAGDVKKKGRLLLAAGMLVSFSMVLFGLSRWFPLSVIATLLLGAGGSAFTIGSGVLLQISVDAAMRSRVTSVFMLIVQLFPLGWLLGGVLAELVGPTETLVCGGATVLLLLSLAYVRSEEFRRIWPGA